MSVEELPNYMEAACCGTCRHSSYHFQAEVEWVCDVENTSIPLLLGKLGVCDLWD